MHLENSILGNIHLQIGCFYVAQSRLFKSDGSVSRKLSTSSLIFSSVSSAVSDKVLRNRCSSICNACSYVMSAISSEIYKKSSPSDRISLDSRLSSESIL